MPAYNAGKYISESIRSVLDQSYTHWELIIINDGSTDDTEEKVLTLSATNKRIIYFFQKNAGQGKARNQGLLKAKGAYIAFLDADDLWVKDKLSIQVETMQMHPEIDLLFSGAEAFKGSTANTLNHLNYNNGASYFGKDAIRTFIKGNKVPILTVLVKREVITAVGNFEASRHLQNVEDSHLWLKLLFGNFILKSSEEVLAYYRIHESQVTSDTFKNTLKAINLIKDFLGRDASIDQDILAEINSKYDSLFIRERSATEKEIVLDHYSEHYRLQDKPLFNYLLNRFPLRGFSMYYRYIHKSWFSQQKMI